jgi:carbon monoxide dehydrogenase subunit G
MSLVTASTEIAAAPAEVWGLVMDPTRLREWVTIHRKLVRHDEGAPHVGYEMRQQIHLRGVTLEVRWKLVEHQPNRLAVWAGRGPARSRARSEYALTEIPAGTRFDYRNEFWPPLGPLGAVVSRALVGGMPQREANRTLELLSERLQRPGLA